MTAIAFKVFSLWALLLPFTVLFSLYFKITAIDKLLAPLLIAIWIVLFLGNRYRLSREKFFIFFMAIGFFVFRNLSFFNNLTLLKTVLWEDTIHFGYFCLPILYIDNLKRIKTAGKIISFNAMMGCLSVFLVAIGQLNLPYERFSQSRIGIENIQKSIGLFSSYGDLAQHAVFFLLLAFYSPGDLTFGDKTGKLRYLKTAAVLTVVMGLIGSQSRSYLLSILLALIMSMFFHFVTNRKANIQLVYLMAVAVGLWLVTFFVYFFPDILSFIASLGGSQAKATAMGRMEQYQFAYRLIRDNLLFGVDAAYFNQNQDIIHGIHNMWLSQLVSGGVSGVAALTALLIVIFKAGYKLLKSPVYGKYGIISSGYMFAVFVSTLFYPADSTLFWVLLGFNAAFVTSADRMPALQPTR